MRASHTGMPAASRRRKASTRKETTPAPERLAEDSQVPTDVLHWNMNLCFVENDIPALLIASPA